MLLLTNILIVFITIECIYCNTEKNLNLNIIKEMKDNLNSIQIFNETTKILVNSTNLKLNKFIIQYSGKTIVVLVVIITLTVTVFLPFVIAVGLCTYKYGLSSKLQKKIDEYMSDLKNEQIKSQKRNS